MNVKNFKHQPNGSAEDSIVLNPTPPTKIKTTNSIPNPSDDMHTELNSDKFYNSRQTANLSEWLQMASRLR